jgi:hypothetical protein
MAVYLFGTNILFADEIMTLDLNKQNKVNAEISGEYNFLVNAVFDDYVKSHLYEKKGLGKPENIYTDLRYYVFTFQNSGDFVIIDIGFNQPRLIKEKNLLMFGGAAKYYWNKKLNKIENKIFFK